MHKPVLRTANIGTAELKRGTNGEWRLFLTFTDFDEETDFPYITIDDLLDAINVKKKVQIKTDYYAYEEEEGRLGKSRR